MATEDPNDTPPADQETNDQENDDVNPPAAKVQKVMAVEEVRETVATAIEEALKKFSSPSGIKQLVAIYSSLKEPLPSETTWALCPL